MAQPLKPMPWPKPVPVAMWKGDYADIRERIRRDGRLDVDDLYVSHSGDSWEAFCGRHGTYGFDFDWKGWHQKERDALARYKREYAERQTEQARQQQERWEAQQRQQQRAKQDQADREWTAETLRRSEEIARREAHQRNVLQDVADRESAREWWQARNPAYATQSYHHAAPHKSGEIDGVMFEAGRSYWVPWTIMVTLGG